MEREKFRKACADLGKAVAEKIKPMAKAYNDLLLRFIEWWRNIMRRRDDG